MVAKKNHIINKIPNLTQSTQKQEVITFFRKHPNLESEIDWNKWKTLTYDDFKKVIDKPRKTTLKKQVKKRGIKGLKKNRDYLVLDVPNYKAYIPLNHQASRLIASKYLGSIQAKWCTAENDSKSWDDYTSNNYTLIYLIGSKLGKAVKYAIAYNYKNKTIKYFNQKDNELRKIPSIDIKRDILSRNKSVIDKAIKFFSNPNFWINQAKISKDSKYKIINNKLVWEEGTWEEGTWKNGIWENGIWKGSTWKNGIWKQGTWEYGNWQNGTWKCGTWEYGIWEGGTWKCGTWEYGIWEGGTWKNGTWEYGTWFSGIWFGGTWERGTWKNGIWEGGTWERGIWERGTWKNGIWKGGIWQNGTWESGKWITGEWYGGMWQNGIWEDGNWYSGDWVKGTWKKGNIYSYKFDILIPSKYNPNKFKELEDKAKTLKELKGLLK